MSTRLDSQGSINITESKFTSIGWDQINYNGKDTDGKSVSISFTIRASHHNPSIESVLRTLLPYIAARAEYDSQERMYQQACEPGIRDDLLKNLWRWLLNHKDRPLYWLNGAAGTGKSTIAYTIAQGCAKKGYVALTFFFSQGTERTTANLIPTLAYQLARSEPSSRKKLCMRLSGMPAVLTSSRNFAIRWKKLITEPLDSLARSSRLFVFVIDALDECDSQHEVTQVIQLFTTVHNSKSCFKLLVSRDEDYIYKEFNASAFKEILHCVAMKDFKASDDTHIYLRSEFSKIH
jgi:NACHT domain